MAAADTARHGQPGGDPEYAKSPGADTHAAIIGIDTPLGDGQARLIALEGQEEISRGFTYRITLAMRAADAETRSMLGKPVTLWLANHLPEQRRPIHGILRRLIGQGEDDRGERLWRGEVVPRLWFLTQSVDCRIFQGLSIPEIITKVFDEHGLSDYRFRGLNQSYPKLDYCVQYRESAHDFVSRLMEHVGLFHWHEHGSDRHLLVISDVNAITPFTTPRNVAFATQAHLGEIQLLESDYQFRPGRWTLNDYNFEAPGAELRVDTPTILQVAGMTQHEIYDYPGGFTDAASGKELTRRRIEMEEAHHHRVQGSGSCTGFGAGYRFTLDSGTAGMAAPASYLLVSVSHSASDNSDRTAEAPPNYTNSFTALPADTPFRPELLTRKPYVRGLQTATVVGPSGENIACDRYGRVRAHFHWDRIGKPSEETSCWIRVAQMHSGSHYGGTTIPHVGHEVVVSFLEGDPDRPLIVGAVPNARALPPVVLPRDKDKTVQRDHGDNKIVMQGKAGQQHLSLVSPRSLNLFAVRSVAKALSSEVTFAAKNNSFSDAIDGSMAPYALNELLTVFSAMDDPGAIIDTNRRGSTYSGPQSANNTAGAVDPDGTEDTASAVDINSMSEGDINGLSLRSTNTWVYKNSNSWVNGNASSQVNGSSYSSVMGDVTTGIQGSSTTTVAHDASNTVKGTNFTYVDGNNAQVIGGTNDSLMLGLNTGLILGGSITAVAPISMQLFLGLNSQLTAGLSQQWAQTNVQMFNLNIQHNVLNASWDDLTIDESDLKIATTSTFKVENSPLHIFT